MKFRTFLFLIIVFLLIAGCYDMKQDEKGRTIKINKITGEVSVIEGDKIIRLKNENDIKVEQKAVKELEEAKTWPEIPILETGDTKARLITKWSDGNLYYQFYINKNLRDNGKRGDVVVKFTIELFDNASFLIEKIPVNVSRMTGAVGSDNKTIELMEFKDQMPMNDDTYKKIKEWNVTWLKIYRVRR
jgi:hypothetical protein